MDFDNLCHDESEVARVGETLRGAGAEDAKSASLSAVDRLMWRQLDNALMVPVNFVAFQKAVSLNVFDRHYCQMRLSELLY